MNDHVPHQQSPNIIEIDDPQGGGNMKLRIVAMATFGLTALVVLAHVGGSLNVTQTGLTMNVNAPR